MTVYLNGAYLPRAQARVPVDDRGFLFGDGVYEVTRALDGRLFEWARHLRRLARGLDGLDIVLPGGLEGAQLLEVSQRLLEGARGAAVVTTTDLRWERCDLKTINLLPNVLAKQQAVAAGAFEAMLVRDGLVTEGASSNVLAVIEGVLTTHPATPRILAGITREVVLELAAELGLRVTLEPIPLNALSRASEVMVTATTADVMPIVKLDGRAVGDSRPGPVARRLHAALRDRMQQAGTRAPAGASGP